MLSLDRTKHYYTFRNWVGRWSAQNEIVMILGFSWGAGEAKGHLATGSHERQTWPEGLQGYTEESRDSDTNCHYYTLERLGVSTNQLKSLKTYLPSLCLCFRIFWNVRSKLKIQIGTIRTAESLVEQLLRVCVCVCVWWGVRDGGAFTLTHSGIKRPAHLPWRQQWQGRGEAMGGSSTHTIQLGFEFRLRWFQLGVALASHLLSLCLLGTFICKMRK